MTETASETFVLVRREGFTESMRTDTSLIRRKIKSGSFMRDDYRGQKNADHHMHHVYLRRANLMLSRRSKRVSNG